MRDLNANRYTFSYALTDDLRHNGAVSGDP